MLKEQERAVVDGREPGTEPGRKAHGPALTLDRVLPILPFDPEGRVGHQAVKAFAFETVPTLAVAEGVAEESGGGVLVLDEHVRTADRPELVVVFLAERAPAPPARSARE